MAENRLGNGAPGPIPGRPHAQGPERQAQAPSRALAEQLSRELTAPVGILDPGRRTWLAVAGGRADRFPSIGEPLLEVAGSSALRLGRVGLWKRPERPDLVWLVLPLTTFESADLVAFAGFRAAEAPRGPRRETSGAPDHDRAPGANGAGAAWGPCCPEPALRAWGQQVVNRLQGGQDTRLIPVFPPQAADEEGEHVVIGRLIRRMRISDPPPRFQALATNVLKTSLGMEAVAWIPSEAHEPVVVSGEVEGLNGTAYRGLLTTSARESTYLANEPGRDAAAPLRDRVRRYASVPAGSAGWLVSVNPLQDRPLGPPDVERMQYVASLIAAQASNAHVYAELKELFFGIIRALTAAIDAKDPYTFGHSERVARIAVRLAEELGMPAHKRSDLFLAGLLHDIGKIGIEDGVLKKNGPLTPEEYRMIQAHVEIGVTILKDLRKLQHILPGVRHHHESMDGSGYPDRLAGEAIPIEARILAVADSFDAMSSNRPYRKRLTPSQIDDIFRKGRGSQWDERVVDALFACRMDVEAIRQKGLGESLIGAVNVTLGRS